MENHFDQLMNAPEGNVGLDFSVFDDPLAAEVSWEQMHEGGNSFETHKLQQISPQVMAFRPSLLIRIFPLIFLAIGLFLVGIAFFD